MSQHDENYQHLKEIHDTLMNYYDEGTLSESFDDVYDIKYIVNSDRSYNAVMLLLAVGGPDIWLDTYTGKLKLYWWTDKAEYDINSELSKAIDEIFQEYYECT